LSVALKIVPYTGSLNASTGVTTYTAQSAIEFDETETRDVVQFHPKSCVVLESQNKPPAVYDRNATYNKDSSLIKLFKVSIYLDTVTTNNNVDALFNENYIKHRVYYEYRKNAATYTDCILDPNYQKKYFFGELGAGFITTLNFFESVTLFYPPSGRRVFVEVTIDPDGRAIKLDGYKDVANISPVVSEVNLDPKSLNQLILKDIQITLNDSREFYNPSTRSWETDRYLPFRKEFTTLKEAPSATYATVSELGVNLFKTDDMVIFSDGVNTDIVKITYTSSVRQYFDSDCQYGECWQRIHFHTGSLTHTYSGGDIVTLQPWLGKNVIIQIRDITLGVATLKTVFRGVIRQPFDFYGGGAILKVDNLLAEFLDAELKLATGSTDPHKRCDSAGSLVTTITWTKSGTGVLSGITYYESASLGLWTVTFSDATNFTVTGLGIKDKAGTTGADFYDKTDATDSQIKIPLGNWSGTPQADDVVIFYSCLNFENLSVPEIMYQLSVAHAGIDTDLIDMHASGMTYVGSGYGDYTFNDLYKDIAVTYSENITISFDSFTTIGEAILAVQINAAIYLSQNADGKLALFALNPEWSVGYWSASGAGHYIDGTQSATSLNYYNEIVIKYGFDYTTGEYQYSYIYPGASNYSLSVLDKKRSVEIEMPAIYDEATAELYAKRYYSFWAFGPDIIKTDANINGAEANIGQQSRTRVGRFDSQSLYGAYNKIVRIERNLLNPSKATMILMRMRNPLLKGWQ